MIDKQKRAIEDMKRAGLGYAEIALKLGLSVNTVKSFGRRCVQAVEQEALPDGTRCCAGCGALYEQPPHRKPKRFCSDACRLS